MKLSDTVRIELSIAEMASFANQHPQAAKSLFSQAAARQQEHMKAGLTGWKGVVHKVNMAFDTDYRKTFNDSLSVKEMATKWNYSPAPQASVQRSVLPEWSQRGVAERVHNVPDLPKGLTKRVDKGMSL